MDSAASRNCYAIDGKSKNWLIEEAFKKLAIEDYELNLRYGFSEEFELENGSMQKASR